MEDLDFLSWLETTAQMIIEYRKGGRDAAIEYHMRFFDEFQQAAVRSNGRSLAAETSLWVDKAITLCEEIDRRRNQPLNFGEMAEQMKQDGRDDDDNRKPKCIRFVF